MFMHIIELIVQNDTVKKISLLLFKVLTSVLKNLPEYLFLKKWLLFLVLIYLIISIIYCEIFYYIPFVLNYTI